MIQNTEVQLWIMMRNIFILCALVLLERRAEASQDVMKALTINFTKALDVCKTEMDLPDTINSDFLNFWKEGYELSNPMTGCAVICLSSKLSLVEPGGALDRGHTQEFAKKHGADDSTAKRLADLLHQCETAAPAIDDTCLKALGVVKCFKAEIHYLNWAPDMPLHLGEIFTEI